MGFGFTLSINRYVGKKTVDFVRSRHYYGVFYDPNIQRGWEGRRMGCTGCFKDGYLKYHSYIQQ